MKIIKEQKIDKGFLKSYRKLNFALGELADFNKDSYLSKRIHVIELAVRDLEIIMDDRYKDDPFYQQYKYDLEHNNI